MSGQNIPSKERSPTELKADEALLVADRHEYLRTLPVNSPGTFFWAMVALADEVKRLRGTHETADESVGCGNCAEAHHLLSAAGIADGDLGEKIDDLVSDRDSALEEFERYKRALQTANGFLIMNNLEPVKLEYASAASSEKSSGDSHG